jgi:hypothetical protein
MNRKQVNTNDNSWYIFAGCALIGFGIGMAASSAFAGLVIGAGVGFLAMVASSYTRR